MDELYQQTYLTLYSQHDIPINPNTTIWEVIVVFFVAVLLITILTIVLDQWLKDEIKQMEKQSRILENELLKMGIDIKTMLT
jgi:capsular polysaccharide biosynthesis protein